MQKKQLPQFHSTGDQEGAEDNPSAVEGRKCQRCQGPDGCEHEDVRCEFHETVIDQNRQSGLVQGKDYGLEAACDRAVNRRWPECHYGEHHEVDSQEHARHALCV